MKALTIKQPFAELIVSGVKDIENRSWPTKYRGRIYIHAGLSKEYSRAFIPSFITQQQFDILTEQKQHFLTQAIWHMGAIIGEVDIVDCITNSESIWAIPDSYHWVLANAVKYNQPILNIKGQQSFWNPNL